MIATGHKAGVLAPGQTEEELEKRLGATLMAGDSIVSIDNCDRPLGGVLLCQMLSESTVRPRILGLSKAPELRSTAFIAATGNNLRLVGDLTRRAILCRLDPKVERPESRVFDWEPVAVAKARRPEYAAAVLTLLRGFHVAGRPGCPAALGSFEEWSDLVRGALLWVGAADPVETMEEIRRADPRLDDMNGFVHPDFREALLSVAGRGGTISNRHLGTWLRGHKDRVVGFSHFEQVGTRQGFAVWQLITSTNGGGEL
jgi:putative DNA primase/helicase